MRTRFVYVRKGQFAPKSCKFRTLWDPDDNGQSPVFRYLVRLRCTLYSGSGRTDQPDSERRRLQDVEECSIEKSEYSSTEFQGFVGLTPGKPISSMMSQSCCRIAIADRRGQWFQPTGTSL